MKNLGIIHTITGEETPKNTLAKDVPFLTLICLKTSHMPQSESP
jgi:hypothetical protein